jgi:hypothetical protein
MFLQGFFGRKTIKRRDNHEGLTSSFAQASDRWERSDAYRLPASCDFGANKRRYMTPKNQMKAANCLVIPIP